MTLTQNPVTETSLTLATPIEATGLTIRHRNALIRAGYRTLSDIADLSEADLKRHVGIGKGGAAEVRRLVGPLTAMLAP